MSRESNFFAVAYCFLSCESCDASLRQFFLSIRCQLFLARALGKNVVSFRTYQNIILAVVPHEVSYGVMSWLWQRTGASCKFSGFVPAGQGMIGAHVYV